MTRGRQMDVPWGPSSSPDEPKLSCGQGRPCYWDLQARNDVLKAVAAVAAAGHVALRCRGVDHQCSEVVEGNLPETRLSATGD